MHSGDLNNELVQYSNQTSVTEWSIVQVMALITIQSVIWVIGGCKTNDLKNELLFRYSSHDLNSEKVKVCYTDPQCITFDV